jgi:hypothetical protein
MADRDLGRKLGQQGFAALHQRWTAEVHIPQYLVLVNRVLESKKAKASEGTLGQSHLGQVCRKCQSPSPEMAAPTAGRCSD